MLDEGQTSLIIDSLVDGDSVRVIRLDEEVSGAEEAGPDTPIKKCMEVKLTVRSSSGPALRDVCVSVDSALPLTTHPSHFTLPEVSTHTPHPLIVTVVATPTLLPTSTHLTLSATYTSTEGTVSPSHTSTHPHNCPTPSSGLPQVMRQEVELPIHLFCEPDLPDKAANHKVGGVVSTSMLEHR